MAGAGVSLNWGGFDKTLSHAAGKLSDTKPLMADIGEVLVSGTVKRFREEKDPQGKTWEKSARAKEESGQTLSDTGRLRSSIDYAATSNKVMVGSNVVYARIHQLGGEIKPKKGKKLKFKGRDGNDVFVDKVNIPARPYLGVSSEDLEEVKAVVNDFLKGAFS